MICNLPLPTVSHLLVSFLRICLVGEIEKWGRMENREGMKKWEDRRDFNFPQLCLIGVEK